MYVQQQVYAHVVVADAVCLFINFCVAVFQEWVDPP